LPFIFVSESCFIVLFFVFVFPPVLNRNAPVIYHTNLNEGIIELFRKEEDCGWREIFSLLANPCSGTNN